MNTGLSTMLALSREEVGRLRDEVERLTAMLDKLPKTADGVPIVPGMRVYYPMGGKRAGEIDEAWINANLNIASAQPKSAGRYCWYSTRQAAERQCT